ncbi:unnamed protein product [Phytophthora fragariaefolia]|uniref:Unnamed protein product n=1 Tax=Phytophthora fragariaefolia TaxID=1490495 RepID=A0A9W6X2Y1_9STRA|nr:unnamed protein product [Phytophthora fragariaefolia]
MARGLRQGVNNKESPVSSTVATVFERAAISGDDTTLVLGGLAEIVVAEQEEASRRMEADQRFKEKCAAIWVAHIKDD